MAVGSPISRRSMLAVTTASLLSLRCREAKRTAPAPQTSTVAPNRQVVQDPDDHLEPDTSIFSNGFSTSYYELVRDSLLAGYSERECQMIALPSFKEEYAVFLACRKNAATVILRAASIWTIYFEETQRKTPMDRARLTERIKSLVHEYSAPVSGETVELLRVAWTSMLVNVAAFGRPSGGVDGARYHFAHGWLSGSTYSPTLASRCGKLVAVGDAIGELAWDAPAGTDRRRSSNGPSCAHPEATGRSTTSDDVRRKWLGCQISAGTSRAKCTMCWPVPLATSSTTPVAGNIALLEGTSSDADRKALRDPCRKFSSDGTPRRYPSSPCDSSDSNSVHVFRLGDWVAMNTRAFPDPTNA
jgi:hypothetical protein